ncbi:hypothetical protein B296_00054886 [Ensete ventricosum]|uniref:Uncharacterized protein n=1 Tax=Ensete ventricosum TaxID=4639 RepID=A0A426Y242_ENSVE|nr:hypothetical protein B296_00054886 [Ensete ventricosum]
MGLATPWYRRGETSVESSIPCSYGGRTLVVKGAKKVDNTEANSKYQDKAEGQRPKNFTRPVNGLALHFRFTAINCHNTTVVLDKAGDHSTPLPYTMPLPTIDYQW